MEERNPSFSWIATDRPLDIPSNYLNSASSTETLISIFVRGVGVGITHTKNLLIRKHGEPREACRLEVEQEEIDLAIGKTFQTKFHIPSENS